MNAQQIAFVKEYLPFATQAGKTFNMAPLMILSQAAFESGWGTSHLAQEEYNFFGITGYGAPNTYWNGEKKKCGPTHRPIYFRSYESPQDSFLDFARLIYEQYHAAWQVSRFPHAYAREIAYSSYITEQNGDNREIYEQSLVSISNTIRNIACMMDYEL